MRSPVRAGSVLCCCTVSSLLYSAPYRCTPLWWSLPGAGPSSAATWSTTSTPRYGSGLCWVKSALQHGLLQRSRLYGVLNILCTVKQLVERAGPGLREAFRHNDEHIKVGSHLYLVNAAQLAGGGVTSTGLALTRLGGRLLPRRTWRAAVSDKDYCARLSVVIVVVGIFTEHDCSDICLPMYQAASPGLAGSGV